MHYLPALVLALFAVGPGALVVGTHWLASGVGVAVLLGCLLVAADEWPDPLGLGSWWPLPFALWAAGAASALASPVPRAGLLPLLLWPGLLSFVALVRTSWAAPRARRNGLGAVALVVGLVALWALLEWAWRGGERPAMPLGHHGLLGAWLAVLLPLLPLDRLGPSVSVVAGATLLGTRSIVAWLGAAVAVGGGPGRRRTPRAVALVVLLAFGLLLLGTRLGRLTAGNDPSLRVRVELLQAGLAGVAERPLLGWGPGATAWTLGPRLTTSDPALDAELVGDLHALPVAVPYELGLAGTVLSLLLLAALWQRSTGRGRVGLTVAAITSCGVAGGRALGWGLAVALVVGAALPKPVGRTLDRTRLAPWAVALYVAFAVALLGPVVLGHRAYDRARVTGNAALLEQAIELDPGFPLYPSRLGWARGDGRSMRAGASLGWGIGPLWLSAAAASGDPESARQAVATAPGDPVAAFLLLPAERDMGRRLALGVRALAAEPRLLASPAWDRMPETETAVTRALERWPGIDAGWRMSFAAVAAAVERPRRGDAALGVEVDQEAATSLSIYLFRRLPWPARIAAVPLDGRVARRIDLPPATAMPGTRLPSLPGLD